jgi:hypothetical protein
MYLAIAVALFFLGSGIALGPIEHFGRRWFPKPSRRRSPLKRLAIIGGVEAVALMLFLGYAWLTFDPVVDRSFSELMLMVLRQLAVAGVIQCVAWPVVRWLAARKPSSPDIRRSLLTAK